MDQLADRVDVAPISPASRFGDIVYILQVLKVWRIVRKEDVMVTEIFQIASSWSLLDHYTKNLVTHPYELGQRGYSICQVGGVHVDVYDNVRLLYLGRERSKINRPRKTCKLCEKILRHLAGQETDIGLTVNRFGVRVVVCQTKESS